MKSSNIKSDKNNNNENKKEISSLKQILAPMVLEVIGKNYTDIYAKHLDEKYSDLIDNILKNNRFSSYSNLNTKMYNGDESFLSKNTYNRNLNSKFKKGQKNTKSTYWKDYDFINNIKLEKKKDNKDKSNNLINMVGISKNNQSIEEEEENESIVIKNKENENEFGNEDD